MTMRGDAIFPRKLRLQVALEALTSAVVCQYIALSTPRDSVWSVLFIRVPMSFLAGVGWGILLFCVLVWWAQRRRDRRGGDYWDT
jgi:sugar phosphate permease